MVVPTVCSRVMVVTLESQAKSSERISISVPASSSIVLPSKKVISALELPPVFTVSPTSNSVPTTTTESSVPSFITDISPSVTESIVSV